MIELHIMNMHNHVLYVTSLIYTITTGHATKADRLHEAVNHGIELLTPKSSFISFNFSCFHITTPFVNFERSLSIFGPALVVKGIDQ